MAFSLLATYVSPASPQELLSTKINQDNVQDLLTLDSGTVTVRLGDGAGGFGTPLNSPATAGAHAFAVGNFTADTAADVVTANGSDLSLLVGDGNGVFAALRTVSLPSQTDSGENLKQLPTAVVAGDLNGDGKMDLAVAAQTRRLTGYGYYGNYYELKGYVNVLIADGLGGFTTTSTQLIGQDWIPISVAISDLDSDGKNDVMTTNSGEISVNRGDGAGGLGTPIHSGSGAVGLSASLVVGDLDEDGKPDTILRTPSGGLRVQKGDGFGRFAPTTDLGWVGSVQHVSVVEGDVNADGKVDLVSARSYVSYRSYGYYGGYDPFVTRLTTVILGQGSGTFSAPQTATLSIEEGGYSTNTTGLRLTDFNRDGLVDLALIDQSANTLAIALNDGQWVGVPGIQVTDSTVTETDGVPASAVITVSLSSSHNAEVRVDYRLVDRTANAALDYSAASGTLIFAPGIVARSLAVSVTGDQVDEFDEFFEIELSNASGGQINDAIGTVTIFDNDLPPFLSISDVAELERSDLNATPFEFVVTLSTASEKPIFVEYALVDGTAKSSDNDFYYAPYGQLYLPPGEVSAILTAYVVADGLVEPNETFSIQLSNPSDVVIVDSQATAMILNDDNAANMPSITISDAWSVEGNSGSSLMYFEVSLTFAYSQEIRVNYRTTNGSATTSTNDYVATSGTLRFAPNVISQMIVVTIRGDKKKEADEIFFVLLSSAVRSTIADDRGVGTIINDDGMTRRGNITNAASLDAALAEMSYQDFAVEEIAQGRPRKRRL